MTIFERFFALAEPLGEKNRRGSHHGAPMHFFARRSSGLNFSPNEVPSETWVDPPNGTILVDAKRVRNDPRTSKTCFVILSELSKRFLSSQDNFVGPGLTADVGSGVDGGAELKGRAPPDGHSAPGLGSLCSLDLKEHSTSLYF